MIKGQRVTVGNTPTALNGGDVGDIREGKSILVTNRSAVPIDLGGADVATGAGYELQAGEAVPLALEAGEVLYGVTASGTAICHVLRQGVT